MGVEIERKFLVEDLGGVILPPGLEIDQGYLSEGEPTVRVRTLGPRAFLTVKASAGAPSADGAPIHRLEFEYEIPHAEALELLQLCRARLTKVRHLLPGHLEVDVFTGRHAGLIVAEYESEDGGQPVRPEGMRWTEVTADRRYSNSWMARHGVPPREG